MKLKSIALDDLFYAYRKAKVDCFKFTDVKCVAMKFATYEEDLANNLKALLLQLHSGKIAELLLANLGTCRLVPKKLSVETKDLKTNSSPHAYFSDPHRAFANTKSSNELVPEFRLIGDFPVIMHILSALWINKIGHKYDATLSSNAYGSRLRRYHPQENKLKDGLGEYHLEASGSFQPYYVPYKRWRENGLHAMRTELQSGSAIIAISLDLTSYYHNIDPDFAIQPAFLKESGIHLEKWEIQLTSLFVDALKSWSKLATTWVKAHHCKWVEKPVTGVPIGLAMARVLANALLVGLDRSIEQGLTPVYYGRYVDDIFLVISDPGNLSNPTEVLSYIADRSKYFPKNNKKDTINLILPFALKGKTKLILKQSKQKMFFLRGQGGLDLLGNIETQIRSVSSERRMMPSPSRLEMMTSAKVLTAAGHPSDEADTLRKADGLVVRRLGWSIQLRAVEILARDLYPQHWAEERKKFYQFAHTHILRPNSILDQLDYLPRLLSVAVSLRDWDSALKLVRESLKSLKIIESSDLKAIKINGSSISGKSSAIWRSLTKSVLEMAADAIIRSIRWSNRDGRPYGIAGVATELFELVGLSTDSNDILIQSRALRESDWAKIAYKDHLRREASRERPSIPNETSLVEIYVHRKDLQSFLSQSKTYGEGRGGARVRSNAIDSKTSPSLAPYLFPTRPYSTQEISLFLQSECIFSSDDENSASKWARYVRAIRGIWVRPSLTDSQPTETSKEELSLPKVAELNGKQQKRILLGISSLLTTEESFVGAASGKSDISPERYARIERVVNQAIRAYPKPTHLLLPELALPERWVDTVSSLLREAGISLISGIDYHHVGNEVHSEAVLILTDNRLGFPASVQIRQQKSFAAAGEEHNLLRTFGKTWSKKYISAPKPIYNHNGFTFGVLICSELQNVRHRLAYQGNVDCVMVLSWNKDLDTFSALVESASLDVHAHIALVNNRKYGDSRVRSPAKSNYGRDLCRVRGGKNEHVVVVELDITTLRAFQSRATRWPGTDDPFKPVPEGYRLATYRKTTPR